MGNKLVARDVPPSHYLFKIECFSLLLSNGYIEKHISNNFDAGGYKWRMSVSMRKQATHLSMCLEILETSSLPPGWEVNTIFNFFIQNQNNGKYYSLQDGRVRKFHGIRTTWVVAKFIDKYIFSNSKNGYLVNDTCVLGAEVFVVKGTSKREQLSIMSDFSTYYRTWKVDNFSTLLKDRYECESFGSYNWKIQLYPNGCAEGKGNSISVFLCVAESSIPPNSNLFTKFILRVRDQANGRHFIRKFEHLFSPSSNRLSWGMRKFMSLAQLNDPKKGFLVADRVIIEAEVTLLGVVLPPLQYSYFSSSD